MSLDSDGERILNRGAYQFLPRDTPEALTNLLCPPERVGYIDAEVHDARSIVHVTGCPDWGDKRKVSTCSNNFDPWIRFLGLEKIELSSLSDHLTSEEYDEEVIRSRMVWYDAIRQNAENGEESGQGERSDAAFGGSLPSIQSTRCSIDMHICLFLGQSPYIKTLLVHLFSPQNVSLVLRTMLMPKSTDGQGER